MINIYTHAMASRFRLFNFKVAKIFFLFLGLLVAQNNARAQISTTTRSSFSSSYTAITLAGGATALTGGTGTGNFTTSGGTSSVTDGTAYISLPFSFTYMGTSFTTSSFVGICTNGYIYLTGTGTNASKITTALNSNLYSTGTPNNTIAPWFDDLNMGPVNGVTGSVLYQTTGSSGSHVLTIQWGTFPSFTTGNARALNFQVKLYETTNVIEFWYGAIADGAIAGGNITNETASIGIEDGTGGDGHYIDAVSGSSHLNYESINTTMWPKINYRFTPGGAPSAVASGTYTVGSGGNYPSLSEAAADLNHRGVTGGAITLSLTDAVYDKSTNFFPILFGPIAGTSGTNTITIQPSSGTATIYSGGNSNQTVWNTLSGASNSQISNSVEPVIALIGTDFIRLSNVNLYIESWSNLLDRGLELINYSATDGATNNTFTNIAVTLNRTNTSSIGIEQTTGLTSPTGTGGANSTNKYQNLTISNTYRGINLVGNISWPDISTEISTTTAGTFNTIGSLTANDIGNGSTGPIYGVHCTYQSGLKLDNCIIRNITTTGAVSTYGIYGEIGIQGTCEFKNNKIYNLSRTSNGVSGPVEGMEINISVNGSGHVMNIVNNMISGLSALYSSTASSNIVLEGIVMPTTVTGNTYNVYYNSVSIDQGSSPNYTSTCIVFPATSTGPVINTKDNIFANFTASQSGVARHFCIYTGTGSATYKGNTGSVCNNNDLYVANSTNGYVAAGGSTPTTYAAITGAGSWNAASGADANSINSNPTYVDNATNLHPAGTALTAAGSAVSGITTDIDNITRNSTPTIGASEFVSASNDAGVIAITSPTGIIAPGAQTVTVTVKNYGTSTLTAVKITLTVNGSSTTSSSITTSIAAGGTGSVTYGSYTFPATTTDILVSASTSLPNTSTDGNPGNDIYSTSYQVALTGTYTVGKASQFRTITDAVNRAVLVGISASTIFSLTDNVYAMPDEVLPITIGSISGTNSGSTLTISPASGVSPVLSVNNSTTAPEPVFLFSGAQYVIIDGSNSGTTTKDFAITNTDNGGNSSTIALQNGASNNIIKNCLIYGATTATVTEGVVCILGSTAAGGNNNNTIQNNDIGMAATSPANGFLNSGTSGKENTSNLLTGNRIMDFKTVGIYDYHSSVSFTASFNELFENAAQAATTLTAIQMGGITPYSKSYTLNGNWIHDLKNTGATDYGINLVGTVVSFANTISNNMISMLETAPTAVAGIFENDNQTSAQYNIYFNTLYIGGTVSGSNLSSGAYYRNTGSTTTTVFKNNILFNARTGGTGTGVNKHYAMFQRSTSGSFTSDYNDIYNTGGTDNVFGLSAGTDRTTLGAWKTATSQDANSLDDGTGNNGIAPSFTSTTDLRLTSTGNTGIAGEGIAGTGVLNDINGTVRSTGTKPSGPTMGVNEPGGGGTLPIQLTNFTVEKAPGNMDALLNWTTASELDNDHFDIEVATVSNNEGLLFVKIGEVAGHGTSVITNYYSFIDRDLNKHGIRYYRLKQVDIDGKESYSEIKPLDFGYSVVTFNNLYPNPAANSLSLQLAAPGETEVTVSVANLLGEELYKQKVNLVKGVNNFSMDIEGLSKGVYLINISDSHGIITHRKFEKY